MLLHLLQTPVYNSITIYVVEKYISEVTDENGIEEVEEVCEKYRRVFHAMGKMYTAVMHSRKMTAEDIQQAGINNINVHVFR